MRSDAKASTAAPTRRRATGLGRPLRGAFGTGAASGDAGGSSAPSQAHPSAARRSLATMASLLALSLLALLLAAAPASAGTSEGRQFLFSFDGSGSTAGRFTILKTAAVDDSSGAVYVLDEGPGSFFFHGHTFTSTPFLSKFHPDGTAWNFSAAATSSLFGGASLSFTRPTGLGIDNSGGSGQGRIYVSQSSPGRVFAFDANGEPLWDMEVSSARDVAVDNSGQLWVARGSQLLQFASSGSPPALLDEFSISASDIEFDANGNGYVGDKKYVGGDFESSPVVFEPGEALYADRSSPSGHLFATHSPITERQRVKVSATGGQFRLAFGGETTADLPYNATTFEVFEALVALDSVGPQGVFVEFPTYVLNFQGQLTGLDIEQVVCEDGAVPLSGGSGCSVETLRQGERGDIEEYDAAGASLGAAGQDYVGNASFGPARPTVAYYNGNDHVYLVQGGQNYNAGYPYGAVAVFGSPQPGGTVPDATIEAVSGVTLNHATLHGKVNPQSVPNSYRFEWKRAGNSSWATAKSSPPLSLPEDSEDHEVEYEAAGLVGEQGYIVRLVTSNTEKGLNGFSAPTGFTTPPAAAVPTAAIDSITPTTSTALIEATIDPQEDETGWKLEKSTDPACTTGFTTSGPTQFVPAEETGSVAVESELSGLTGNQHVCLRISATNSAGTTISAVEEFLTDPIPPTGALTAFAAPRTDTTARLNARVNPEGANPVYPMTYRFEYSSDGGASWTALPDLQYEGGAREQLLVGEELGGLQPSTSYQYRFSAETATGPASPQGEVKTFTTRSAAEMVLPERGFELVNNPDKGVQSAAGTEMSRDGERVLWVVAAAPGGTNGFVNSFLAKRTQSGWVSQNLIPPVEEQIGEGSYEYGGLRPTPDLSRFVTQAVSTKEGPRVVVRLDDEANQEVLSVYENYSGLSIAMDLSDDGSQVVVRNDKSGQVEEVGSGAPEVVSIMPGGSPSECGIVDTGGSGNGFPNVNHLQPGAHMIATTDASRVYFETSPDGECGAQWGLYVRNRDAETTTLLAPGAGTKRTELIYATPDGRTAYFLTFANGSTGGSGLDPEDLDTNEGGDVYRWDEESGESTCLTCVVVPEAAVARDDVFGNGVLVSEDQSHVYFESAKQLVPGQGRAGARNLYVLSKGELRFIGEMGSKGLQRSAAPQLSTDGNLLAFKGRADPNLTTDAVQCPFSCDQLFLYDDREESVECLSCVPGGVTTSGLGGGNSFEFRMSRDGSAVAFYSEDALVALDVNRGIDLYEHHGGATGLLTDGVTSFAEGIITTPRVPAISDDGSSILIHIVAPNLTGFEHDELLNGYVVRIGGGFEPPPPPVHCDGDACQGPLQPAPLADRSASASFEGRGNVSASRRRCGASKLRRGRRCVSKRALARRACRKRKGKAKRRCIARQMRRLNRIQRRQRARANRRAGR